MRLRPRGFTLLELMVVVAIIAISTAVVSLALPDPSASRLEREAARLIAFLESARAEARAGGLTVIWVPQPNGPDTDYQFMGLPPKATPAQQWLEREVRAEVVGGRSITLGPEPVVGPQSIVLRLEKQQILIGTDGLGPFDVVRAGTPDIDLPPLEGNPVPGEASAN
ncbi:type II secretion system protein GspH [Aquabacterium lacunae]|uniref:Type II secretion system protein GspH n=1 Tax=Aquabacterium lacunae TaxID=2528630 RepID=A0A4Q9H1S5_9BURK|nr:prepilin-type N-terminal cleavage/methylation domain-containing protein [Aquabacterium lacunae]TBO29356.1 type II secretion system protein GspH [Aquabacterium lacunae]